MECSIAFGSNLGDRLAHLRAALAALRETAEVKAVSPVYHTAPVDCPAGSLPFLNAVVLIEWCGTPLELLHRLRGIEAAAGRPAERSRNAPRPVDLDILHAGPEAHSSDELTLPHPRLHQRRFVLEPLCDAAPGLVLPGFAVAVSDLLARLPPGEPPLRMFVRRWA